MGFLKSAWALVFAALSLSSFSAAVWGAEPLTIGHTLKAPAPIERLHLNESGVFAVAKDGRRWRLEITGKGPRLVPATAISETPAAPPDGLPDGVVRFGADGLKAWLTDPTRRYDHGVLGDGIEAGGLRLQLADGTVLDHRLEPEFVFEDRQVRFWTLDGGGGPELGVVMSGQSDGARLAIYGIVDGKLSLVAQSAAIGQAYRWLNPVGSADFDGDGRTEIAVVITPHLGALLRLYRRAGHRLETAYEAHGFSNHGIGMRSMALAAVVEANGDGIPDIVSPNAARNAMRIVSFAGGKFRELARISHDAGISGDSVVFRRGGRPVVAYPLTSGEVGLIFFPQGR